MALGIPSVLASGVVDNASDTAGLAKSSMSMLAEVLVDYDLNSCQLPVSLETAIGNRWAEL